MKSGSGWELLSTDGYSRLSCRPVLDSERFNVELESKLGSVEPVVTERSLFAGVTVDQAAHADLRSAVADLLAGPFEPSWYRAWRYRSELGDALSGWHFTVEFGDSGELVLGPASVECLVELRGSRLSVRTRFVTDATSLGLFLTPEPQGEADGSV